MKTKTLIIIIVLIGLGAGGFFIWKNFLFTEKLIVEGSEHWVDREIILDSSLIIKGSLTIENVILKINSKTDGEFKIDVEAGGELRIIDSTTTAADPQFGYQFYYRKGSKGYIKNSIIEYTSAGEDVLKTGGHGGLGGLNVFTDGFVLRNSIIRNSKGRGVLIGRAKDALISDNIFADNGYDGLRIYDSLAIRVENNTGYGNVEYAIKAMYSKDIEILNNIARNNKDDGIHINTCENILIEGNEIFDNGRDGLQVGPGREEGGSAKIFAKNNKVRRNEENGILFLTTSDSEISGNVVEENGENGILIQWECKNVTVSKNTAKDNGRTEMVVLESSNVIVSDNKIDEIYHDQTSTIYPSIEAGKGRIIFDLKVPEKIITRKIVDDFLVGVSTVDHSPAPDCASTDVLRDLRINGINYFLPYTQWPNIERKEGFYNGEPCPGDGFISWLDKSGAIMNGHCLIFFIDFSVPEFVVDRPFDEQKKMVEEYVKRTIKRYPEIEIWNLNEPIAQNFLKWSRDQVYDVFVSASQWIHEVNPEAKVMVNMIPIECDWGGLDYEPNEVMDDLIDRGLEADIIGIEFYYWWAEEEVDENSYPTLDWIKRKVNIFRKYNLPILFSEIGVPGIMEEKEQWSEQADWMEKVFRFSHDDQDIMGAVWFFVHDHEFMPYAGLVNDDYTFRPVGERLIGLADEWNPSTTHDLNGQKYLDLDPGEYDVIVDQEVFRVSIVEGQVVKIF